MCTRFWLLFFCILEDVKDLFAGHALIIIFFFKEASVIVLVHWNVLLVPYFINIKMFSMFISIIIMFFKLVFKNLLVNKSNFGVGGHFNWHVVNKILLLLN